MPDYHKMYKRLFQSQTQAIELHEQAVDILKKAQQDTEEMYISAPEPEVRILDAHKPGEKKPVGQVAVSE